MTAGKNDTLDKPPQPIHKNVIKLNLTPMILWSSRNITLSYERVLGPRQSVTITAGYLEFGPLFGDTIGNIVAITSREKGGINLSTEYRFYLWQRNRYPTPNGLYIAPYASFYGYRFRNGLDIIGSTVDSAARAIGSFYCFNLGFELGYQFILWKRFAIDLVLFGPSISYYGGELNLSSNIDLENRRIFNQEIYDKIQEQYPLIKNFYLDKEFKKKGTLDLFSVGFRYVFQIGFHF